MIKITYFSHFFAILALALFFPKMKLDSFSVTLFSISILLNIVSINIIIKKKNTIKKVWFFGNLFLNVIFICLFTYTLFMLYQLKYG
ncbi:hypothetical protein DRF67_21145 [Chryseobacterium pennipullorum]|uniref:Uncharacterized protein n=1 Tax=Chryseobacterium pennipullorum TaxID=2258963 RepID=A0A3D9AJV0_9FLAO|nr:hypothetical protein DRF67_21145 [Chryseobacterium pennipullorum]